MKLFNFITLLLSDSDGLGIPSGDDFISKVFPNMWAFLVQLVAFIIMVIVVIKLAYKPIKGFIEKRREYIESNLESARVKNEEATKNLEESKAQVLNSRKEAVQIIQDARNEATKQKDSILESTNLEIAAKQAKAIDDLRKEQEKAIKSVHDEVVDLAIETSKSILNREVNVNDDDKMINELVNELMEK